MLPSSNFPGANLGKGIQINAGVFRFFTPPPSPSQPMLCPHATGRQPKNPKNPQIVSRCPSIADLIRHVKLVQTRVLNKNCAIWGLGVGGPTAP